MILQGVERARSLAIAVVGIARARRSALLNPADLWDLVKVHCPEEHKPYWAGAYSSASAVAGLLQVEGFEKFKLEWHGPNPDKREVGELRRLIETKGVLFWDREPDQSWRIVDTQWLISHRDIWDHIHRQWPGGFRCRLCEMAENPQLDELKNEGRDIVHERCRPHLIQWRAIAAQYASEDEAQAADHAAGRQSRYEKVGGKPTKRLEAPIDG